MRRILTLANNDRIPMLRPNVTLQFEVEDLRNASPATVSRAGIIYVSMDDLGWLPMAKSYLATREAEQAKALEELMMRYIPPMLDFVTRECSPPASARSHPSRRLPRESRRRRRSRARA